MRELQFFLAIKVYKRWGMILGCEGRMKGRNLLSAVWCSNRERKKRKGGKGREEESYKGMWP